MTAIASREHVRAAAALRERLGATSAPAGGCGIACVDEEHAICDAARAAAMGALERRDVAGLAFALGEYRRITEAHFRSEEDLMAACEFPHAVPHAAAHAQYLAFLDRCIAELARGGLGATVRSWIAEGVPQWVAVHAANDRAIHRHVARAGMAVETATPWRAGVPELRAGPPPAPPAPTGSADVAPQGLARAASEAVALSQALANGDDGEARRVLGALGAGLRELFAAEERLMAESAYVGAAHHALAHDLILADLALLGHAMDAGEPGAAARWAQLRSAMWFETHRALADEALQAHLASLE